jgi:hypothetical protein
VTCTISALCAHLALFCIVEDLVERLNQAMAL